MFCPTAGDPVETSVVTRAFQAALKRAGLPRQRFHDLRHVCATVRLEDGEDITVVSKILGHANLSTTADIYSHLTPTMAKPSAERMDGILRRTS